MSKDNGLHESADGRFSLGLFGDTRSGKTVYLTALQWLAEEGQFPVGINGLRPGDAESARYLGRRVAQIRAGQWPEGTIDTTRITLILDTPKKSVAIHTCDFRGGDFGAAWYDGDHEDTERFVQELFGGASAAVFLVDPAAVKEASAPGATVKEQEALERRVTGVVTALEILRKKSRGFRLFHRPVALVFTKCDEHPDVMADPEGFARTHMRQTYDYLRRHARKRHRFFAVSSTGPLAEEAGAPPEPLKPENVFAPVLWCEKQHKTRTNLFKKTVCGLGLLVILGLYAWLYMDNRNTIHDMRRALPGANAEAKAGLYVRAKSMRGYTLYLLTHPVERERLRQEIANSAEEGLRRSLSVRVDSRGNLRTVPDYREASQLVATFEHDYTGTENAHTLAYWLGEQREMLAKRKVDEAIIAAKAGNEGRFYDIWRQYLDVETKTQDKRMELAWKLLLERKSLEAAKMLGMDRSLAPTDIDKVRESCRRAEEELDRLNIPQDALASKYVRLVREVYDDLAPPKTAERRFALEKIEGAREHKVKWTITITGDDGKTSVIGPSDWHTPAQVKDWNWYRVLGGEFSIDVLKTSKVRFEVEEDTWLGNGTGPVEKSPQKLAALCRDGEGHIDCTTDEGNYFKLVVSSRAGRVWDHYEKVKKIEELEDVLLREKSQ